MHLCLHNIMDGIHHFLCKDIHFWSFAVEPEPCVATTGRVQFRQIVPPQKLMQHIQKHV